MRALHSERGAVPLGRVIGDYRAALLPLAVVLGINIVVLVAAVLPLSQRVTANEQRAEAAERQRAVAEAEFKRAETFRQAQTAATQDLERFYAQVLPSNVAVARRLLSLRLQQMARAQGVQFQGSGTTEEELRDSSLLRLTMSSRLSGDYEDIRAFIYELETSPDFIVIDELRLAVGTESDAPLSVFLQVSTYYRAPGVALAAGRDGR